ncbi:hypothetical protein A6A04_06800 [Paramagnetospirillum marisnigri]|uniref:Uncharacterized protein n=1 Tax=Paramagnetospirillum marisnigri TaxID=1285242 RepID=A0A178MA07_9PROT|nr:hypothetical protein [Paramagnetospirillum marisnigri]OAN45600.1 hypothetical protein A6A04_06800 [Paramagnetospirillum marisnigri]
MTWETGNVTRTEINRLAAQIAAGMEGGIPDDELMRRCVGMALSQDLSDDELAQLVREVDAHTRRHSPNNSPCRGSVQAP